MKLTLDTDAHTLTIEAHNEQKTLPLYSKQAFEALSRQWVRVGWNEKYQYGFSWMGRPIIQLPEDMIRMQEVIFQLRPDWIIETGIAHGGSLIYYASLCKTMDHGRVLGIDIEIRPHNRAAIEAHPLFGFVEMLEGSSIDPAIVQQVATRVQPGERVLVILDSNHSYDHVYAELEAYAPLVSAGSYLVATDGIMQDLHDVPRGLPHWATDNPTRAAADFCLNHPEFVLEQPIWPFQENSLSENITHWPGAWLKRRA